MKSSLYPVQRLRLRAMSWAVKLRVNPRVIRVQEMRWKWGSCSSAGTVTLAADLVEQDERFQDYVIVHELLHLRFPTHGRVFKSFLSAHVPGWREMESRRAGRPLIGVDTWRGSFEPHQEEKKWGKSHGELTGGGSSHPSSRSSRSTASCGES